MQGRYGGIQSTSGVVKRTGGPGGADGHVRGEHPVPVSAGGPLPGHGLALCHPAIIQVRCCCRCLLVALCSGSMLVYLRDGSAQTILRAATLR